MRGFETDLDLIEFAVAAPGTSASSRTCAPTCVMSVGGTANHFSGALRGRSSRGTDVASCVYYSVPQCHTHQVSEVLNCDVESVAYICSRSRRYSGAADLRPEWTDPDLVALEPDPKARIGASRFIGHSFSAARVLVVIAYRDLDNALHGVNAWPATGADQQLYEEGCSDG